MSEPIDISVRLHRDMAVWPGSVGFHIEQTRGFAAGDEVNVSRIEMDVHCGTHVEGSLHFIDGGEPVEAISLDTFVGPAHVIHIRDVDQIGPDELESASLPPDVERLLVRTRNSELWHPGGAEFRRDYVALTAEGARWIASRAIRLIGIDYLSVQRMDDDPETHRILMRAGVAILEGLDLSAAEPGPYRLVCLPIRLGGAEAAPARAILERLS